MLCRIVLGLTLATALCAPAFGQEPSVARVPMSDADLGEARGGFIVDGNLAFEFGAVVRTFAEGVLALQTEVNWTDKGAEIVETLGEGVMKDPNLDLSGLGTVYTTANGANVVHSVANGQLTNLLINRESNGTFRQETDVTLVLPGFDAIQKDMSQSLQALRFVDELAASSVGALGN